MHLHNLSRATLEFMASKSPPPTHISQGMLQQYCLGYAFRLYLLEDDSSLTQCLTGKAGDTRGGWELWVTSWLTHTVLPGDIVLDIGANCGYYTMLMDRLVGSKGKVIAYEPNPRYGPLLKSTKNINCGKYDVRLVALADYCGKVMLRTPGSYVGSSSIVHDFEGWDITEQEVEVTTLNQELKDGVFRVPNLVKIDAEGAEEAIIDGASDLLEHPVTWMIEFTPKAYSNAFVDKLWDMGEVSRINFSGQEEDITKDFLNNIQDWEMIVVRPR